MCKNSFTLKYSKCTCFTTKYSNLLSADFATLLEHNFMFMYNNFLASVKLQKMLPIEKCVANYQTQDSKICYKYVLWSNENLMQFLGTEISIAINANNSQTKETSGGVRNPTLI